MSKGLKSWDSLAQFKGDFISVYKYLKGGYKDEGSRLFSSVPSDRIKRHLSLHQTQYLRMM